MERNNDRIYELISKMTVEEKISQLTNSSAAVSRLGINKYDWWNEALHGGQEPEQQLYFLWQSVLRLCGMMNLLFPKKLLLT